MGFTPYDWNENIQHRVDYVETRLRQGSPVVGHAFQGGVLLLSIRRTQRKVFEVFDHILFSAIGSQSDVEAIRIGSIDFASQEGFNRSPDDVSVQRLVTGLSPTLKKAFADGFSSPFIVRGIFAELGREPDRDQFTTLNYDGEYAIHRGHAAIAGSAEAEKRMRDVLTEAGDELPPFDAAVRASLNAWAEGRAQVIRGGMRRRSEERDPEEEEASPESTPQASLAKALEEGQIEVGILERHGKTSRFRLLPESELNRIRSEGT